MSQAIWKHGFNEQAFEAVSIPVGAQILHAAVQLDRPTIWFLCDPDAEREVRTFTMVPTGSIYTDLSEQRHVATFLLNGGALVAHLFEGPVPLSLEALGVQEAAA